MSLADSTLKLDANNLITGQGKIFNKFLTFYLCYRLMLSNPQKLDWPPWLADDFLARTASFLKS